jgi:hypothetical protein
VKERQERLNLLEVNKARQEGREMSTITVPEIANRLNLRMDAGGRTVLFLGARAGAFFRNATFYDWVQKLSIGMSNFSMLEELDKFAESHRVLKGLNQAIIHDVLKISQKSKMKDNHSRPEDNYLVDLAKAEFFDTIIATNIDGLLERAFDHSGMVENYGYHVYIHGLNSVEEVAQSKSEYCKLFKVFGDLGANRYATFAEDKFALAGDRELKEFLETTLAKSILVLGFDPVWDAPIERYFPEQGGELWFVNETLPQESSLMGRTIQRRGGKYIAGPLGSYRRFVHSLHFKLIKTDPESSEILAKIFDELEYVRSEVFELKQWIMRNE